MMTATQAVHILIGVFCIFHLLTEVYTYSSCKVTFPDDTSRVPQYTLPVGKNLISIPYENGHFYLHQDQRVSAYCGTGFEEYSERILHIYCEYDRLRSDRSGDLHYTISCAQLKWHIYEADEPFTFCEMDVASLILASGSYEEALTLAGVCMNLQHGKLRTLHYRTHSGDLAENYNELNLTVPPEILQVKGNYINAESIFIPHIPLGDRLIEMGLKNHLINLANYDYFPLAQGGLYYKYFESYGSFLQIAWWQNLRHGNWKRFTTAFDAFTINNTYDVFMGTSGVVWVPEQKENVQNLTLTKLKIGRKTLPAYIWQYVKSVDGNEEFVFIGYNSPFSEFFAEKEIIFCKNICDQISWLDNVRSTFNHSVMGITFCCSVEEVRNFLDGFPIEKQVSTTIKNDLDD